MVAQKGVWSRFEGPQREKEVKDHVESIPWVLRYAE
jgi:hypothetical protein